MSYQIMVDIKQYVMPDNFNIKYSTYLIIVNIKQYVIPGNG